MALDATTIWFVERAYTAIARAADAHGISVSQYVREVALIRAVLDEVDSAEEAIQHARARSLGPGHRGRPAAIRLGDRRRPSAVGRRPTA